MNEVQTQIALKFIEESNRIEGIHRAPTKDEVKEFGRFMELTEITMNELIQFVSVYQPDAVLRSKIGLDVRIGRYYPPRGGLHIAENLQEILQKANDNRNSYVIHDEYEELHPFTDCNGRSGRMLWAWQMGWDGLGLGFLHRWYYQSLDRNREHETNSLL